MRPDHPIPRPGHAAATIKPCNRRLQGATSETGQVPASLLSEARLRIITAWRASGLSELEAREQADRFARRCEGLR